ncbi:MAG: hypothetical protein EP304_02250 [Deltaproteobacteria bacterium]|nr:MAG: hypothetical protein EP304_02250 [Deltaproteobacteria bacterium]
MNLPCLRQTDAGVEVFLYIQPRASRNKVVGLQGEELKVALTAPPVDGAANKACCLFIAKLSSLPRSCVRIISGETSRHKRLLLEDADILEVTRLVEGWLGG